MKKRLPGMTLFLLSLFLQIMVFSKMLNGEGLDVIKMLFGTVGLLYGGYKAVCPD